MLGKGYAEPIALTLIEGAEGQFAATLVIRIILDNKYAHAMRTAAEEVKARGAKVYAITDIRLWPKVWMPILCLSTQMGRSLLFGRCYQHKLLRRFMPSCTRSLILRRLHSAPDRLKVLPNSTHTGPWSDIVKHVFCSQSTASCSTTNLLNNAPLSRRAKLRVLYLTLRETSRNAFSLVN